jgi:hypothetical protein
MKREAQDGGCLRPLHKRRGGARWCGEGNGDAKLLGDLLHRAIGELRNTRADHGGMAEREHAGTGAQGGDALGSASRGSRSIRAPFVMQNAILDH